MILGMVQRGFAIVPSDPRMIASFSSAASPGDRSGGSLADAR
jgi:hypothetical protein